MLSYLQLRSQKVSPMSCDDEMEPNGTLQIFNTKNKAVVLVKILMRIWDVYSNKLFKPGSNHLNLSNNKGLCEFSGFEPYFPCLTSDSRHEGRENHETICFA